MPTSDVLGLSMWTFVGILQLLFGATWIAAARLSDPLRRSLLAVAWFNLLVGASLLLLAWHGGGNAFLTGTLPNLLQAVGYVLLWRAGTGLTGAPDAGREQRLLLLVVCPLLLLLGSVPGLEHQRQGVSMLANIWVLVRGCIACASKLQRVGATVLARAMRATCTLAVMALAARATGGLVMGDEVDLRFHGNALLGWLLLAPICIVNVLGAYQAFGRTVEDANRLSRLDRLTGLADATTLDSVLVQEWRRLRQWGSPVVVLELGVDQLDAVRQVFGAHTADAVLAELSWKLKLGLRAGDVLAHCGDGLFRVVLPGTRRADALVQAQELLAQVGSDGGLHPESGQRLTLSIGLAEADADDTGAQAVLRRAQAQAQCARLAGGDRVAAEAVVLQPQAMLGRRVTAG